MANLDEYGQPLRDPASAVLQRKFALAQALQRQGGDTSPVVGTGNTSMQVLARVLQGGLGGYLSGQVEGEAKDAAAASKAEGDRAARDLAALVGGSAPPTSAPEPAPAAAPQMTERLGGAPPVEAPAPVPPVQQQALPAPVGPSGPPSMYGRNAGAAAQRDAMLDAPPQVLADASSARAAQSGLPTNVAYRGATPASEGGDWDRGVPAPTGAVPAFGSSGASPTALANALAAPQAQAPAATPPSAGPSRQAVMAWVLANSNNPNPAVQRQVQLATSLLPTIGKENTPGPTTEIDGPQGPGVYERGPSGALRFVGRSATPDPLERIRMPDGSERLVPRRTAGGMVSAPEPDRTLVEVRQPDGSVRMVPRGQAVGAVSAPEPDRNLVEVKNPDGTSTLVPRSQAGGRVNAAPAPDTFGRSNTLRDEYRALTGDFRTVQTAFQNIQQASKSNNGAGDMSMLYSYVKMLDPGSVVRESEFATAAASGSFGERIQGAVQRVISGERLPDTLRQSFVTEAKNLHTTQRRTYDHVSQQYRGLAERNRLNPDDVVTDFITPEPAPPAAPAGTSPPAAGQPVRVGSVAEARQLPSGTPIILPDGSQGRVP